MTHKQNQFKRNQARKCCKTKTLGINDETQYEERSRRALLLSSEDVDRMAGESSRARLMMQLVSKPEETSREFGSYFRGQNNESKPVYIMTSHTSAIPIPKRLVPVYPSLIHGLKLSSSVEAFSQDSKPDTGEDDLNYTCKCHKRTMKHCLGRGLNTGNIHRYPRDNIMTFSDNSTMTPVLTDIGCGARTPLKPTPVTSEVSMATSEIVVKPPSILSNYPQTNKIVPIPILKKCDCRNGVNVCQNIKKINKSRVTVTGQEAVIDTNQCDYNDKLFKLLQTKDPVVPPCPNNSNNSSDCGYVRKVIYNEGISDLIKKNTYAQYPVPPLPAMRIHPPMKVKRNISKISIMSKCFDKEVTIPYAHRIPSKYHSDCKPSSAKSYRCENEEDSIHRTESPLVFRRAQVSKSIRWTRTPSSRLPKKLLTSERDIEAFVDKTKSKKCPLSP